MSSSANVSADSLSARSSVSVKTLAGDEVHEFDVACDLSWSRLARPIANALGIKKRCLQILVNSEDEGQMIVEWAHSVASNGETHVFATAIINDQPSCASCGDFPTPPRFCSGCRLTAYCNSECQLTHWIEHRATCRAIRESLTEEVD